MSPTGLIRHLLRIRRTGRFAPCPPPFGLLLYLRKTPDPPDPPPVLVRERPPRRPLVAEFNRTTVVVSRRAPDQRQPAGGHFLQACQKSHQLPRSLPPTASRQTRSQCGTAFRRGDAGRMSARSLYPVPRKSTGGRVFALLNHVDVRLKSDKPGQLLAQSPVCSST